MAELSTLGAPILDTLRTVDDTIPGLNADTLDGLHAAEIISPEDQDKLDGIAPLAGQPKSDVPFSASETVTDALHGMRRLWTGTSAGRVTVPDTLADGIIVEYISNHTQATLAPLTIERIAADGGYRVGGFVGGRLLSRGSKMRITSETYGIRFEGDDLEPATMDPNGGGASFLLERGKRQTVNANILEAWGDRYGLNDFDIVVGNPGVGEDGQMTLAQLADADAYLTRTSFTFAGTSLLFGFSGRIDAVSTAELDLIQLSNGTAAGFWLPVKNDGRLPFLFFKSSGSADLIEAVLPLGRPFACGVAINRAAGYVFGFFDEGQPRIERERSKETGVAFNWGTGVVTNPKIGPLLGATQSVNADVFAVTIRDNVSFANVNDARDQAAAMLAMMRSYYA